MLQRDAKETDFCPIARVAELLGDPCTLLLIRDLLEGEKRFKDFNESLSPISTRTIASKLKLLEEHGIVTRKEFKEKPPRVEYKLTRRGTRLHTILEEMRKFGKSYI
jgi:DNA-binding HxlR family transcriptional regulator